MNRPVVAAALSVVGVLGAALPVVAGEADHDALRAAYVIDGDTPEVDPAINDTRPVRMLNIDAPELGGRGQEPWATESRQHLVSLLSGTFTVRPDEVLMDQYDRVLGHLVRSSDAMNVNREQLRTGNAVLHVLWPNVAHFEDYREAQREAQRHGRGIWDPENPLKVLPYAYRQQKQHEAPDKWAGDWFTKKYVAPEDYREVDVNNRVFFWNEAHAEKAGFTLCEEGVRGAYDPSCFSEGWGVHLRLPSGKAKVNAVVRGSDGAGLCRDRGAPFPPAWVNEG